MRKQAAGRDAGLSASCPGCDWDMDDVEDDPEWHADHHVAIGLATRHNSNGNQQRIIFESNADKRWFMFMRGILTAEEYSAS